jgi:hypothetical protein
MKGKIEMTRIMTGIERDPPTIALNRTQKTVTAKGTDTIEETREIAMILETASMIEIQETIEVTAVVDYF